jgi:hypothetical protein
MTVNSINLDMLVHVLEARPLRAARCGTALAGRHCMANRKLPEDDAVNKAGVKSLSKKADNSRHGLNPVPPASPVAGASGEERRRPHQQAGTAASRVGKAAALRGMGRPGRTRTRRG